MDFYLFFFLFVFHKEFLVISHNFNDQVYTIIIAQPNLDNQIGAIERVDINPQPLNNTTWQNWACLDAAFVVRHCTYSEEFEKLWTIWEIVNNFKLFTIASLIWIKTATVTVTISECACCFLSKLSYDRHYIFVIFIHCFIRLLPQFSEIKRPSK